MLAKRKNIYYTYAKVCNKIYKCGTMVRKTKEEAENTRQAIIAAALEVFYQKGYSRTTFDDIAARIGLTKGALYWHFKNKPDLLVELIKEKFYQNRYRLIKMGEEVSTLKEMRDALIYNAEIIKNDPEYRKFLFFVLFQMEWSEGMVGMVGDAIKEIRDFPLVQLREALIRIKKNQEIPENVDVDEIATILLHLWKGALGDEIGRFVQADFPVLIGKSVDLIVYGIQKERS